MNNTTIVRVQKSLAYLCLFKQATIDVLLPCTVYMFVIFIEYSFNIPFNNICSCLNL